MSDLKFSSQSWKKWSEPLSFHRLDAKNPDQTKPVWTEVIASVRGIVERDDRTGYLQAETGLDSQSFLYKVTLKTSEVTVVLNKDRITTQDGSTSQHTHLHIIDIAPVKASIYSEAICSNMEDPFIQQRRR